MSGPAEQDPRRPDLVVGGPPAPGEPVTLATCDDEPIHLPGAIQPGGVLLAVREEDLVIVQVSANTQAELGAAPGALLGRPLATVLGPEAVERLRVVLADPRSSGTDPLVVRRTADVVHEISWHRIDDVLVVELEPATSGESVTMSTLFEDVRHATEALQGATGVQSLCDAASREVRRLTGYDRVMVYRFHPDEHGEVVAEDHAPGLESYKGLHYPASDIPRQARRLYLLNHLRQIADVDYEPVPLVGAADDPPPPLDLSFANLRSVSPIHLQYLRNMGVQATLTISLMQGTRLWGMLACHHGEPRRVGAQLRAACRLLGQMFSLQVAAKEQEERNAYRVELAELESRLVTHMSGTGGLAAALADGGGSPLALTAADGLVARIDGHTVTVGTVPPATAVDALLEHLRRDHEHAGVFVCDELGSHVDGLAAHREDAAGVLAVALSPAYADFALWFRRELVHTVTWGGEPPRADDGAAATAAHLTPRTSFAAWHESVRGRSRPWAGAEVDVAQRLAAAVPELLLARARDRLAHMALHDTLTGLPNRALVADRVEQALARAHRLGRQAALLFVDVDRFKLVNDSLGHAGGDSLLCQAAGRLLETTREIDTVARLGGDEFVVLCEDVTAAQASLLAGRIVDAFHAPFAIGVDEVSATVSVGVAMAEPGTTPAALLRDADTAMYRAKHGGRNAAASFTPELRAIHVRRVEIETGLRPALDRGELALHFQPIHAVSGELRGFEALARWPLAGRGMVPPAEFIPVAEQTGVITQLTQWALDTGLAALAGWRATRPDLDLGLSVNVTAKQITSLDLLAMVAGMLDHHEVPPDALCLEITERALVGDDAATREVLTALRDHGVRLSIDDFGTGFSALAYLAALPVDEVKIDRAFVRGLPAHSAHATVVASVVGLAHQLGLRAVAEGVETDEQLAAVRRLGCDLVQGYLLGRPMPASAVDRLLARTDLAPVA